MVCVGCVVCAVDVVIFVFNPPCVPAMCVGVSEL